MERADFNAALRAPAPDTSRATLARRFNAAFRKTQDMDSAMSAVNELLTKPLTYQQFFALIKK